ncbi:tripartite tricarboxylate transporter substrate binding protein [Polaromonas sp. P1(28)-13]|nr:tripartite tricarboxylate transporter substrate binding protein [Polaromonas sp. P1(28)-13]
MVIDNKAGAAGNIAADLAAKAPADGYTLLLVATSHATNINLYSKIGYDPIKDFAPISILNTNFFVVVVPAASSVNKLKELVSLAKLKDRKINYASAGSGQANHLGMELLKTIGGFDAVHVPYTSMGAATNALLGGQVDVAILSLSAALPQAKAGKLKILAMTAQKRSTLLPDVPTVVEAGFPGYELTGWQGLLAPAGTPKEVVDKLSREAAKVLHQPDVVAQLSVVAAEPVGSTPQEFAAFLQSEITKWGKVIKQSGAKAE